MSSAEAERIRAEYRRRAREISPDRYAAWQPAEVLARSGRRRLALELLHRAGVFPDPEDRCLEVGCGGRGWLPDLLDWGVREPNLAGIDLDEPRIEALRRALPAADLRTGDAVALPWDPETFRLVITSTMFSSILDPGVRRIVAREIVRVLRPGGAVVFYDLAVDNPSNRNVRGIGERELRALFPDLRGDVRSVTLAPPIARVVAPISYPMAAALALVPWLRTHRLAVLVRP